MKYLQIKHLTCNYCKKEKPIYEMVGDVQRATGRKNKCKECHNRECREYARKNYVRRREIEKASYRRNKDKRTEYRKKYEVKLRHVAIMAYGGYKCSCECGCDVTQPLFLTIDHINGGSYKLRKESSEHAHIYRWLKKHSYPEGYRVLCMNCNQGRWRNGGECPGNSDS